MASSLSPQNIMSIPEEHHERLGRAIKEARPGQHHLRRIKTQAKVAFGRVDSNSTVRSLSGNWSA
jgi:hypothetical protein